jgi:signal transduction histidine kinase
MKAWLKRHWPRMRLRTLLFGIFLFVAALPGISAVFLRVYENTLVRQTEAELITQGAAIVAAAGGRFDATPKPVAGPRSTSDRYVNDVIDTGFYRPEPPKIDLSASEIEPERPDPSPTTRTPDPQALARAQQLEPIIDQTVRTTLASIILIDPRGIVLNGGDAGLSYAKLPEVADALAGKISTKLRYNGDYHPQYSFEWLTRAAAVRVHHVRPILIDGKVAGAVLLSRSSRALFRGMYEDRGKIALGVALIFGILVLLTMLLNRTIAQPIVALSAASRGVADGRGTLPDVPTTAAVEICALYEDFATMSEVIARRSRYLRDFAAAVSHEFKTPLAGIRGGIELIEDHHGSMSAKERQRFLGNISADADRLSHLVSRLLDLARADMVQPEGNMSLELASALPGIADAMRGSDFAVSLSGMDHICPVAVPHHVVETILIGLMDNSRQAGATAVTIAVERRLELVELSISDNGPGISPADRERLFEPFFTTRRTTGGTGLGLSIARSLMEGYSGSIDLAEGRSGAVFVIKFPLARNM